MTNEDIEQEAQALCEFYQHGPVPAFQIAALVRKRASRAYEEAAQIAETWGAEDDEPTDPDVAFDCLAAAIRAEKPSPIQESVASI
jgi:hypothetical protein